MCDEVRKLAYAVPRGDTDDDVMTADERMAARHYGNDEHCEVTSLREFRLEELSEFDGSKPDMPILLAVLGEVYDVTLGKKYYGPDGPYCAFAGRDATRGLATYSLVIKTADKGKVCHCDLSTRQLLNAKQWQTAFKQKYKLVGTMASQCSCRSTVSSSSGIQNDPVNRPSGKVTMSPSTQKTPPQGAKKSGMCYIL